MSLSEWFWTKVGFALIGFVSGSIWCLIFFPFLSYINPDISGNLAFKVFAMAFVGVSLISEKIIGSAGLGALYALYGFVSGLLAVETASGLSIDMKRAGKELMTCVLLGCLSALMVVLFN